MPTITKREKTIRITENQFYFLAQAANRFNLALETLSPHMAHGIMFNEYIDEKLSKDEIEEMIDDVMEFKIHLETVLNEIAWPKELNWVGLDDNFYKMSRRKTLTVLIPRQGLPNSIVFEHDDKLGKIIDELGCKWYGGGMMLDEGEGYRDMTFDVDDDFDESLVAEAIEKYNEKNNIKIEFHFHDPKL